jgi:hypothetical protein
MECIIMNYYVTEREQKEDGREVNSPQASIHFIIANFDWLPPGKSKYTIDSESFQLAKYVILVANNPRHELP